MSDHKKDALAWINGLEDIVSREGQTDATLIASPLIANAYATLYLAEQQRLANLIASIDKWGGESNSWPYAIKEGLGLA